MRRFGIDSCRELNQGEKGTRLRYRDSCGCLGLCPLNDLLYPFCLKNVQFGHRAGRCMVRDIEVYGCNQLRCSNRIRPYGWQRRRRHSRARPCESDRHSPTDAVAEYYCRTTICGPRKGRKVLPARPVLAGYPRHTALQRASHMSRGRQGRCAHPFLSNRSITLLYLSWMRVRSNSQNASSITSCSWLLKYSMQGMKKCLSSFSICTG